MCHQVQRHTHKSTGGASSVQLDYTVHAIMALPTSDQTSSARPYYTRGDRESITPSKPHPVAVKTDPSALNQQTPLLL